MTTFNFTDRASYLQWRAEWKANYKQLSTETRKAKIDRSTANSAWGKLHRSWYEDEAIKLWTTFHNATSLALANKQKANELLELLKEAKVAAAASYRTKETEMNTQNLDSLIDQMKSCEQAKGLSIYQHGLDVANRYRDFHTNLQMYGVEGHYKWDIPDASYLQLRVIAKHALSPKIARIYHIFHDCGKPSCLTIDSDGRRHFPDHAKHSTEIYKQLFPEDTQTIDLISKDMLCHTLKSTDAADFAKDPQASTLILTAWSELHANAEALFGGFNTDSFKIKRKGLIKMTALIYKDLSDPQKNYL